MTYPIHPAAELFPLRCEGDEWEDFLLDVQLHGIREPIVLWKGRVIDGRRRLRAKTVLEERGFPVRFPDPVEWDELGSLVAWVYSRNLHRRDLTARERALAVAEYADRVEAECAHRGIANLYGELGQCEKCGKAYAMTSGGDLPRFCDALEKKDEKRNKRQRARICGGAILRPSEINEKRRESNQKLAGAAGVSRRTMQQARKLAKKGAPALKLWARGRGGSMAKAAKLADLPPEEQVLRMRTQATEARRRVEASELERALGDGGRHLESARKALLKAQKSLAGYDARSTLRAIERAEDRLADDAARLLAQAKTRAAA